MTLILIWLIGWMQTLKWASNLGLAVLAARSDGSLQHHGLFPIGSWNVKCDGICSSSRSNAPVAVLTNLVVSKIWVQNSGLNRLFKVRAWFQDHCYNFPDNCIKSHQPPLRWTLRISKSNEGRLYKQFGEANSSEAAGSGKSSKNTFTSKSLGQLRKNT